MARILMVEGHGVTDVRQHATPLQLPITRLSRPLDRVLARLAGADPHDVDQLADEHLAVADLAGLGRPHDGVQHGLQSLSSRHDDLDLDLGDEIDLVLGAAVHFGVALLAAETADLGDGHAHDALLGQRVLDVVELEMPDDRFHLLHQQLLDAVARRTMASLATDVS